MRALLTLALIFVVISPAGAVIFVKQNGQYVQLSYSNIGSVDANIYVDGVRVINTSTDLDSIFYLKNIYGQTSSGEYRSFVWAISGRYIHVPITTVPSEYAEYKIVLNGTSVGVYNSSGGLEASATIDGFWSEVSPDGSDIRVFDQHGKLLYFWIEEWDYANQKAVIWVRLEADSTELNIAYGNPSATKSDYEDPRQVFEFFDDFDNYYTIVDYFAIGADDLASGSIGIARYKHPYTWVLVFSTNQENVLWRYDHNNKTWEKIASFPISHQDGHRIGNILIDSQNNIHVFHDSGEHTTDGIKHEKSTDGGKTWSSKIAVPSDPANGQGPAYQNCYEWNGKLYLFHEWAWLLDGGVAGCWKVTISSDYGETWGSPQTIIDPTTDYPDNGVYVDIPLQQDNIIHFVWTRWLNGDKGIRKHIYYAYLDLNTMTFYNINGTNLGSQITGAEMDNYCLALNTDYRIALAKLIGLDENNYPHIVFVNIDVSPYEVHHLYWNGSQWVDEVITTTSVDNVPNGYVYASNDIELFVGQSDRVERWKFDGSSWTKVEDIITGVAVRKPICIRPHNDEIKAIFVEYTGDWTSPAKYFAWGKDGFVGRPQPDISQMEGIYSIVSGSFELSEEPAESGNYILKSTSSTTSNLIIHNTAQTKPPQLFKLKIRADDNVDSAGGVIFGYQDSNNFYHARIDINYKELQIYEWNGGTATKLSGTAVSISSGTWYVLEAKWVGDTIEAYLYDLNSNLLGSTSTTGTLSVTSGKLGLRLYHLCSADDLMVLKLADPADFGTPQILEF